jgi:hypothetical protein
MIDLPALNESYQAHEEALHKVQLAMLSESNPVARRELVTTYGRLAEKMETLRNRINRAMGSGAGVYVNF